MTTFYVGLRPVLKGRSDNFTDIWTGKTHTYSYYDWMNPDHVLDGAPDNNHVPGTGYSPGDIQMSREFLGTSFRLAPMRTAGDGARLDSYYFRQTPDLWKGVASSQALSGTNFGHAFEAGPMSDYAYYSNYEFTGIANAKEPALGTPGHAVRYYDVTNPGGFGANRFYEYQGVPSTKSDMLVNPGHQEYASSVVADQMPSDYGQVPAARTTTEHYGFEHVMEWAGVPSAKAL